MSVILSILIGLSCLSALFGFILLIIVYTSPLWLTRFYIKLACNSGTVYKKTKEQTCEDLGNSVCKGKGASVIRGCKDDKPKDTPYWYNCSTSCSNNITQNKVVSGAKIVMWSCLWGGIGLLFIVEVFSQHYKHKRDKHEFILKHLKSQLL